MAAQRALTFYMNNIWDIHNTNFLSLNRSLLSETEKLDFEIKEIHKDPIEFLKVAAMGARRYLLKFKDDKLEQAKVNYQRMIYLENFLKYPTLISIFYYVFYKYF